MDETQSLEALSDLLTKISENPYDLSLHAQHIQLATASGMEDQLVAARQMLTSFWPTGDEIWLPIINAHIEQGLDTPEKVLEALILFQTAEDDYLSIPILQKHVEFLIDRHAYYETLEVFPEELGDAFTTSWTRTMLNTVVGKGSYHLTKSHLLWDIHFNWELEQIEKTQEEDRTSLILEIEDMILERLKQPHSNHEETFQSYSTFTTSYKPPNIYERLLVNASKSKSSAVKAYERREAYESYLTQLNHSPEAYDYYIAFEKRSKQIDIQLLATLYERAISDTEKRRFEGIDNAEAALRAFWSGYCDILRIHTSDNEQLQKTIHRAVRSVPGSGVAWSTYIRYFETNEDDISTLLQSVSEIYEKALSSGLIQTDVEEIVAIVLARAGLLRRSIIANDDEIEGGAETLLRVLEDGITMCGSAIQGGDPRYRLEKYLAEFYINLAASPDLAIAVWQSTVDKFKGSYLAWTNYIDTLIKLDKIDEARALYRDVVSKRLDWPEAIFESWVLFEHLHGSLEELQDCLDKVNHAQSQVNTRRAKEAEKAAYQAAQTSQLTEDAKALITEAQQEAQMQASLPTPSVPGGAISMDVDEDNVEGSKKRKQEDFDTKSNRNKKTKTELSTPLKRDRENCTVFVADLPDSVNEGDLVDLFKDCGPIREIKITAMANSHVATVEFVDRESVPAGLTKDKKRVSGQSVSVHLAWQSTLYVTNFPEGTDDASIRQLFSQFGTIFDVRWPSKKFKATRRFCYIQYTSPGVAQAALSLHGKELEPGFALNVFVSNPERKKERTDAGANDREIYVAGLSKFTTKADLEKLFKTYGIVKEVRMIQDESGHSKGIAFVEFEDEASAQRSLQANNYDLKNRRIAVTLSDSRVRAKHRNEQSSNGLSRKNDIKNRSVRLKGLPLGTQEGLLQQALEKITNVKRLEIFQDLGEATAELGSASDVGKLLLRQEPFEFNGKILQVSEELSEVTSTKSIAPSTRTVGTLFVPRAAASRPRAGLGSKKPSPIKPQGPGGPSVISEVSKGQDDFRKLLG